ncbi:hypothetical protein [Capnocytophaga sp.]|uniref:hypothetical protein n=1 Tax=Capnocytophaga sp. TaxID=44737 RepID=UPI0026DD2CD6|nr:hypothetical protein [Capnocytophaga sp.]MDO5105802.1 hypothetical protein [Capnocytophaga sp.]
MKRTKNQGFGYSTKNQMNSAENFQTRFAQTVEIFHATFIDFLNVSSPMPFINTQNQSSSKRYKKL